MLENSKLDYAFDYERYTAENQTRDITISFGIQKTDEHISLLLQNKVHSAW